MGKPVNDWFEAIEIINCKKIVKFKLDTGAQVRVTEPTEFVNPIVLVKKPNNDIRICLDPQNLNKALIRERYELPTFEE
ncbi:hypothetical protein NQ315_012985 [Exocentrus adspersus]|uniref:Uncharacterized protein n=1 Tax=Exocentrus adspersus TaxID=1586481 RepID=A0AAV8VTL8_9CUCU|nr:hypothetical protein NQ315_012985 [Exocentrus adspersus]